MTRRVVTLSALALRAEQLSIAGHVAAWPLARKKALTDCDSLINHVHLLFGTTAFLAALNLEGAQ